MAKQQGQGRAFPKNLHPLDSIFWKNLALLANRSLKNHFLFFFFFFWNESILGIQNMLDFSHYQNDFVKASSR
ncbi:hypothetical protein SAMN05660206_101189 [Sphingobacterium wenxiniae]|uniref:Uncharacterized protein n=1 Tax=Sphingobacterium wenxiniae TaxID=683125 RepID=A0A1I6NZ39_9SPHI|nr:hypothetical protein SAMN05660206_101189 [Sphingobacterium wenxiniae]